MKGVVASSDIGVLRGQCLDDLDIDIEIYDYSPELIVYENTAAERANKAYIAMCFAACAQLQVSLIGPASPSNVGA